RGVFTTGREAARKIGLRLDGARVAVQGFGNVGSAAAEMFAGAGAHIVAIQDHTATIANTSGLDMSTLMAAVRGGATLRAFGEKNAQSAFAGSNGSVEILADEDFWDVDCDILIPAALEGQIDAARAARIHAKLVLEGAN